MLCPRVFTKERTRGFCKNPVLVDDRLRECQGPAHFCSIQLSGRVHTSLCTRAAALHMGSIPGTPTAYELFQRQLPVVPSSVPFS